MSLGIPESIMFLSHLNPINSYNKNYRKWKFRSKLGIVRRIDRNEILCTYINEGKKYPYNSVKRGWK